MYGTEEDRLYGSHGDMELALTQTEIGPGAR